MGRRRVASLAVAILVLILVALPTAAVEASTARAASGRDHCEGGRWGHLTGRSGRSFENRGQCIKRHRKHPGGRSFKPGDGYVSLGSSIASGFGISVQSTACGRSNRNYPHLIAQRYGLRLVDVSCGAAQIRHVVDTPQGDNPPQLTALTRDTKLVTVTVGGNDIGYNGKALECGDPTSVCVAPASLQSDLAATRVALRAMIEKIRAAVPAATLVLVTYPREVPAYKNCPELSYTDDEIAIVRSMGEELEKIFGDVAAETDVVLVDPYVAPGDHTGCAPAAKRWTSGYVPAVGDGFPYHPTALGHEVMAKMIIEALGRCRHHGLVQAPDSRLHAR